MFWKKLSWIKLWLSDIVKNVNYTIIKLEVFSLLCNNMEIGHEQLIVCWGMMVYGEKNVVLQKFEL